MVLLSVVQKHIERLYIGACNVWEYQKNVDENGITCFEDGFSSLDENMAFYTIFETVS